MAINPAQGDLREGRGGLSKGVRQDAREVDKRPAPLLPEERGKGYTLIHGERAVKGDGGTRSKGIESGSSENARPKSSWRGKKRDHKASGISVWARTE